MRLAYGLAVWLGCLPFVLIAAEPARLTTQPGTLPPPASVRAAVEQYFNKLPDYQPGALLTRSQVEPLFGQLRRAGWDVADAAAILAAVPADGDRIVQILRGPGGENFQRKIAQIPHGYDYVDQLLAMPRGQKLVADLVEAPGGEAMIEYLATTPGGKNMAAMLSKPAGRKITPSTGRIYTADALLVRLKASYDAARKKNP